MALHGKIYRHIIIISLLVLSSSVYVEAQESSGFSSLLSDLSFFNSPESENVYALGIAVFPEGKSDLGSVDSRAREMAAVFVNRQFSIAVVNKEAAIHHNNWRQDRQFSLVAPVDISRINHILSHLSLVAYEIRDNMFIGLYVYSEERREDRPLDNKENREWAPVSPDEVCAPSWEEVPMQSIWGQGEAFSLQDAFYEAYEKALLKLADTVSRQIFYGEKVTEVEGVKKVQKAFSAESIIWLENVRLTGVTMHKLNGAARFRYRVYLQVTTDTEDNREME